LPPARTRPPPTVSASARGGFSTIRYAMPSYHGEHPYAVVTGAPSTSWRRRCRRGAWRQLSAGDGAKGPARLRLGQGPDPAAARARQGHWLLVRRGLADGELAFYVCYGPARTTLIQLVRVAGRVGRWSVTSSRPRVRPGWIITRSAAMTPDTGMSPWRCWPTPSLPPCMSASPRPPPYQTRGPLRTQNPPICWRR